MARRIPNVCRQLQEQANVVSHLCWCARAWDVHACPAACSFSQHLSQVLQAIQLYTICGNPMHPKMVLPLMPYFSISPASVTTRYVASPLSPCTSE